MMSTTCNRCGHDFGAVTEREARKLRCPHCDRQEPRPDPLPCRTGDPEEAWHEQVSEQCEFECNEAHAQEIAAKDAEIARLNGELNAERTAHEMTRRRLESARTFMARIREQSEWHERELRRTDSAAELRAHAAKASSLKWAADLLMKIFHEQDGGPLPARPAKE